MISYKKLIHEKENTIHVIVVVVINYCFHFGKVTNKELIIIQIKINRVLNAKKRTA